MGKATAGDWARLFASLRTLKEMYGDNFALITTDMLAHCASEERQRAVAWMMTWSSFMHDAGEEAERMYREANRPDRN